MISFEPQALEKAAAKLDETGADLVIFDVYQYFMKTQTQEVIANRYSGDRVYTLKENPEMITRILNAAWNKMYRRSLFEDNGITFTRSVICTRIWGQPISPVES